MQENLKLWLFISKRVELGVELWGRFIQVLSYHSIMNKKLKENNFSIVLAVKA